MSPLPAMRSPLPFLGLGLALGATLAWSALRPRTLSPGESVQAPAAPVAIPAWSWREQATPDRLPRDTAFAAVAAWLGQRAPDGAALPYPARAAGLRALLLRLPPEALPRLVGGLARSPAADDKLFLGTAFRAWLDADVPAATRWAGEAGEEHFSLAREGLGRWLADDPLAAAEWACALRDDKSALHLASQALAHLAGTQPDRALALAGSRGPEFRDSALRAILRTLGRSDPAGTIQRFAPELWRRGAGFWHFRDLLSEWGKKDLGGAISWLSAQPHDGEQLSNWISQIFDRSPEGRRSVADAIASLPDFPSRSRALRDLMFNWGNDQPEQAIAWLRSLTDDDLRINLLERANQSFYTDSPQKALPLALALPEGANRADRLSRLLGAWAKLDADATLAWLREHAAEPGVAAASHAVHAALLATLTREDPQAALVEYAALTDPAGRGKAIDAISAEWGKQDPAAALRWAVAQRAEIGQRHLGIESSLLYRWAKIEPEPALRWLEQWHEGQPKEHRPFNVHLFERLGGDWNDKAPRASTADLFTKIRDPELRSKVLQNHFREWLAKDPEGARAWLASNKVLGAAESAAILGQSAGSGR